MWRDDARLLDILLAARELDKYTEGVSFEEFDRNRLGRKGKSSVMGCFGMSS
ncbi:MAG: hypothetical protein ABSA59_02225 [Terriglobia bacterium]|jgi:uncharacterized protein with HEPN domain